jgi:hypothetical protein
MTEDFEEKLRKAYEKIVDDSSMLNYMLRHGPSNYDHDTMLIRMGIVENQLVRNHLLREFPELGEIDRTRCIAPEH